MSSFIFQLQSVLVVGLIFFGLYYRRNRFKHVRIMKVAIVWDLLLIAQIELNRGAVGKASKALSNPAMLNIHVLLAVTTVVLYLLVYLSGRKLLSGDNSARAAHKTLGYITVAVRSATLLTSNLI